MSLFEVHFKEESAGKAGWLAWKMKKFLMLKGWQPRNLNCPRNSLQEESQCYAHLGQEMLIVSPLSPTVFLNHKLPPSFHTVFMDEAILT